MPPLFNACMYTLITRYPALYVVLYYMAEVEIHACWEGLLRRKGVSHRELRDISCLLPLLVVGAAEACQRFQCTTRFQASHRGR